jgi:hypothetical protein
MYSNHVVVFRGPPETYHKRQELEWSNLPVVSVTPPLTPRSDDSRGFSNPDEREKVRVKMRGALRTCAYYGYTIVVVAPFGLESKYSSPPQGMAQLWQEVLQQDPDLVGRFEQVIFAFGDATHSTVELIKEANRWAALPKKQRGKHTQQQAGGPSEANAGASQEPSDMDIFRQVLGV